jgi:hypothetical protein
MPLLLHNTGSRNSDVVDRIKIFRVGKADVF